jgi:hypothetical protein
MQAECCLKEYSFRVGSYDDRLGLVIGWDKDPGGGGGKYPLPGSGKLTGQVKQQTGLPPGADKA